MTGDLVYGLEYPHRLGTVCGVQCEQCGDPEGDSVMTGPGAQGRVDVTPLYIVREATYSEYVASVRRNGGGGKLSNPDERFYYVVTTD